MESYIPISTINDFVFCPRSIYFNKLYQRYNESMYHETAQKEGKIVHESIDQKKYSSEKKWITSLDVYSQKYGLCGKIDMLNTDTHTLIERKNKILKIYDGYKYQLWAQMFCLQEMGYTVEKLYLHSLSDNKRTEIEKPKWYELERFEKIIEKMHTYNIFDSFVPNPNKCDKCIYRELCDVYNPLS